MKTTFSTTALSGLFLALVVTTGPATVLAENGSDRLDDYRMRNQQLIQMKEDSSQSIVRVVAQEPTAAGPQYEEDYLQPTPQTPQYRSLIHQQRIEFGH
ncbi:hypothetical protein E8F11_25525 [Pseudomonas sp. BN417]|uniref:hypothetical protein n=1 Tax=Pseudomonas sp. BN417 TaxID=2567890 RepID=UPI002453C69E|nr:hypothetical protein [Pseudomonas sp. BN417]MDH4558493.1 hypothetical protein [Pseudomonas sp. BN417]